MGLDDEAVRLAEIARWTEQAERLGRALGSSALAARHASSDDIAWLFRHTLMGTLGDPRPSAARRRQWGAGEIESLLEGQVHNGRTLLRLEHPGGESYAAFLSFARFPDVMYFPDGEPWLHYADSLPFPVEVSLRMKLIPPAKASKDVGRRLAHARDMDAHIREAGVEMPIALAEQIEAARLLEHGITKERLPFVYGHHRLMVTAPTRDLCVRRAEAVTEHYRDAGIDVVNSTGDQFSLLCESLPGDKVRLSSYLQRQPLYTIAGGMPTATVDIGDRVADDAGWIRPVHRRDARPGPVGGQFRPAGRRGAQPPDRHRDHRRAGRRQDDARAAADPAACAARGDGRGDRPEGRCGVAGPAAARARPPGPGAAARHRRARPARPVLVRRRPGREADDGHRDAAAAAAENERGARKRDDPGRRRDRRRGAPQPGQGRGPSGAVRRSRLDEPRGGAALDVGDAAGQAVLRPVRRRSASTRRAGRRCSRWPASRCRTPP